MMHFLFFIKTEKAEIYVGNEINLDIFFITILWNLRQHFRAYDILTKRLCIELHGAIVQGETNLQLILFASHFIVIPGSERYISIAWKWRYSRFNREDLHVTTLLHAMQRVMHAKRVSRVKRSRLASDCNKR